jgi:hypothetical protein
VAEEAYLIWHCFFSSLNYDNERENCTVQLIRGSGAQTKATASRVLLILDGDVLAGQFPESRADAVRDCGRPRLDVCEYLIRDPIPIWHGSKRTLLDRAGALSTVSRLVESLRDSLIEAEIPEEGSQVSPRLLRGRAARRSER